MSRRKKSNRVSRFLAQLRRDDRRADLVLADKLMESGGEPAVLAHFKPQITLAEVLQRGEAKRYGTDISLRDATLLIRACTGVVTRKAPRPGYETDVMCGDQHLIIRRYGNVCEIASLWDKRRTEGRL